MAFLNRVGFETSTSGTGSVSVGAAVSGYATPVEAGAVNGISYPYVIEDGTDFEVGYGTYSSSGPTLTRDTVYLSKIGGTAGTTKLTLSGSAKVYFTAAAENLNPSWQFYAALSLEMSEATGAAIAAGNDGNGLFDGFGALTYVDTAGATNLDTSTAGVLKPSVTTATAMTNLVFAENSNTWGGYNLIQLLPAASLIAGGTQARFRMRGPGTGSTEITGMTVAKKASSGDAYDAGETPVAITVSGSGAFTIPTSGDVWSDWINYTLDDTVDLLIKMHFGASTNLRRRSGATGHQAYEKSASSEVTTANVTGYSPGTAGHSYVVEEIQVRDGGADLSVSSSAMTLTATPASAEVIMFAAVNDATINTDLIVAVSRDGVDFQDFTMAYKYSRPDGSGVYVSGPVEITADAGTTGKWQCRTDNKKMPSVKAIGVQFFA